MLVVFFSVIAAIICCVAFNAIVPLIFFAHLLQITLPCTKFMLFDQLPYLLIHLFRAMYNVDVPTLRGSDQILASPSESS